MNNLILDTDSYKMQHFKMLPPGTEYVYSYFEARKGAKFPYTVFFGLRNILNYLADGIYETDIEQAEVLMDQHCGTDSFNVAGWKYIYEKYDGKLPLEIKAVPEGSIVPINNVLMTIVNTDPNCAWLTNYVETLISRIWYPITVATLSREVKEQLRVYLEESGCEKIDDVLKFQLHDFGSRSCSSEETAQIGGAAHLVNFYGTDTVTALEYLAWFYQENCAGYSIPASEHSCMSSEGEEGEENVIGRLLELFPTGPLSVVCDTYNYERCITELICKKFRKQILERDGVFVVRPDSVSKGVYDSPETLSLFTLRELWSAFDGSHNKKGLKVLNPKVRLIWGDGLTPQGIYKICEHILNAGFSTENMVFGMGSGLIQRGIDRDTQRFAFKCSAQYRDGKWHDVYKKPTDESKVSKRGRFKLIKEENRYITKSIKDSGNDELRTVFKNGQLFNQEDFSTIRERVEREAANIRN